MGQSVVELKVQNNIVNEGVPGARTMAEGAKFKFTLKRSGDLNDSVYAQLELKPGSPDSNSKVVAADPNNDYVNVLYAYDNGVLRAVSGGVSPKITFKSGQSEIDLYVLIRDNQTVNQDKSLYLSIKSVGVNGGGSVTTSEQSKNRVVTIKDDDRNHNPFVNQAALSSFSNKTAISSSYFSLKVPYDLFLDSDGDALKHNAYLSNGSPLPSWLSFDGKTFSGIAPIVSEKYSITVTAYDDRGGIAAAQFNLNVALQSPTTSTTPTTSTNPTKPKVDIADAFGGAVGSGIPTPEREDNDGWYTSRGLNAADGHLGEDWNGDSGRDTDMGQDVRSIAAGTITRVGTDDGWGNYVVVKHPLAHAITINGDTFSTVYSVYGHLREKVEIGASPVVEAGQVIGKIGNTGNSTEPHLHLGISTSSTFVYWAASTGNLTTLIKKGILKEMGEFSIDGKYFAFKDGNNNHYYISPTDFIKSYNSGAIWEENKDGISGFSPLAYAANNPDLVGLLSGGSDELIRHYISYGRSEGRTTTGFDSTAYAANNPDLYRTYGLNKNNLLSHYINYGKQEGRKATGFSTYSYAAKNSDLQNAYGTDTNALVGHYVAYGKDEGRDATGFDPLSYTVKNRDLLKAYGTDADKLTAHYAAFGKYEERPATGFNVYAYAAKNPDLYSAYGLNTNSLVQHYATYGMAEGRLAT
ncbi:hypothetical protein [Azospirillum largimobile]